MHINSKYVFDKQIKELSIICFNTLKIILLKYGSPGAIRFFAHCTLCNQYLQQNYPLYISFLFFWGGGGVGAVVAEWLSSWLAEEEVWGSIPSLAT